MTEPRKFQGEIPYGRLSLTEMTRVTIALSAIEQLANEGLLSFALIEAVKQPVVEAQPSAPVPAALPPLRIKQPKGAEIAKMVPKGEFAPPPMPPMPANPTRAAAYDPFEATSKKASPPPQDQYFSVREFNTWKIGGAFSYEVQTLRAAVLEPASDLSQLLVSKIGDSLRAGPLTLEMLAERLCVNQNTHLLHALGFILKKGLVQVSKTEPHFYRVNPAALKRIERSKAAVVVVRKVRKAARAVIEAVAAKPEAAKPEASKATVFKGRGAGDRNRAKIIEALKVGGVMTTSSVAKMIGMSLENTANHLKTLERAGRVLRTEAPGALRGSIWALADLAPPPAPASEPVKRPTINPDAEWMKGVNATERQQRIDIVSYLIDRAADEGEIAETYGFSKSATRRSLHNLRSHGVVIQNSQRPPRWCLSPKRAVI